MLHYKVGTFYSLKQHALGPKLIVDLLGVTYRHL